MSVEKKNLSPAWLEREAGQVVGVFLYGTQASYTWGFLPFSEDWSGRGIWGVGGVVVGSSSDTRLLIVGSHCIRLIQCIRCQGVQRVLKKWGCIRKEELLLSVDCG